MTPSPNKSRCRRIVSTIIWTLVLLLLTNVFWSVWAARVIVDPRDVWFWDVPFGATALPDDHEVMINVVTGRARTSYSVVILGPELTHRLAKPIPTSFDAIAPPWIKRWFAAKAGMDESLTHEQWDFVSVGWPCRMLWKSCRRSVAMNVDPVPWTGIAIVQDARGWGPGYVLPIRPILAGQLFYAVFWFVVVFFVGRIRWFTAGRSGQRSIGPIGEQSNPVNQAD